MGALAFVIDPHWQRARYLLMQCLGVFFLLGAHGLAELIDGARYVGNAVWPEGGEGTKPRATLLLGGMAAILVFGFSRPFIPPLLEAIEPGHLGWNRYDLAFKHAYDNMEAGDKVMTMHPPAGWIYLEQVDYYLVQSSPKLIVRPDGELGDRYTGALWLETADQFNHLLAQPDRLWLVTQEFWLFNSYDAYLQQQILWRMDKKWGEGGVWALASRPGGWPLPREIDTPREGEFENGTRLLGFTANPPLIQPGGVMWLTLFWHGAPIPYGWKIFVQVRDVNNNTVTQADHFIYDNKVPSSRWETLLENDTAIRDGATLVFPPDLPPGAYRMVVGLYQAETFERMGVINDQSGEAAIILAEFVVE
jgi:hypothetical protein